MSYLQRASNYEKYLDEWRIPVGNPKDPAQENPAQEPCSREGRCLVNSSYIAVKCKTAKTIAKSNKHRYEVEVIGIRKMW